MADYIDYLRGYATPRDDAAYTGLNPDFGRRLMAMLERAPAHVRQPGLFESLYRDDAAQRRAINSVAQRLYGRPATIMEYARGIPGHAAPVGGSRHQTGDAADLGWSRISPEGRDWLRSNAGLYGLRFPLPDTDAGHLEYDADWRGELPNRRQVTNSQLPSSPPDIMSSALYGLSASRRAPETSMPPIVSQALRGFKDGGAVEAALRIAARHTDKNPSEAQVEAGNYRKGSVRIAGMDIAIENPKGSTRSGVDKGGKSWRVTMPAHYGYIRKSEGADGDHVDCYIGSDHDSDKVFVIDQVNAENGRFDEHKCCLDYSSKQAALADYEKAFSDGKAKDRLGAITEMSVDAFKGWLKGDTTKPVGTLKKNYAHGGAVMKRDPVAIALGVARRACGGRVGYAEGGDVDPLASMDWMPETERRAALRPGPPAPVARSANTPMGDLLAQYTGSVDVGRNVTGLENFSRDFAGVTDAELANSAIERGDVGRALGHGALATMLPLGLVRGPVRAAMSARPITTGLGFGTAGALAEGGADAVGNLLSTPAQAQESTAPSSNLPALLQQYDRAGAEVRRLRAERDAQRPRGRTLDPERDRIYYNLDEDLKRAQQTHASIGASLQEAQRLESERQGLATRRETQNLEREAEEARRRSPEFLERQRRIEEATKARDAVRANAPKPFNEAFPTIASLMPFAPIALGAATGALMGRSRMAGERAALNDWRGALDRAATTTSPRVRGEMIDTASAANQAWPKTGSQDKVMSYAAPMTVAGLEGAFAANLPYAYNSILLGENNPEREAQQVYYRGLPDDHPDKQRTLDLLNNEAALPRANPPFVEARDYFSHPVSKMLPRSLAGAGEAAAFSMPGTTVINAMRPHERALPRARTLALENETGVRRPRATPLSGDTQPALSAPPTPLPALPPPAPAAAPPAALSPTPPPPGPASRTSTSASESPPHHSHLQPREAGRFAGPPKKPRKPRRSPEDEAADHHTRDDRLTRGQKDGGWVRGALDIARRYAFGGRAYNTGGSVAGPIIGDDGGRDDHKPVSVKSGSFVIPSDIVSGLPGAGHNTLAGMRILKERFGEPDPRAMASGGSATDVPIRISSGEFVVAPDQVAKLGNGDMEKGHRILEAFVKKIRAGNVKEISGLPPPARD